MNTAVQPAHHFQPNHTYNPAAMSFDLDWLDQQSMLKASSGCSAVDVPRPRHLKVASLPVNITFGQIDILWKLDRRTLERMATDPSTPAVILERLADHPMAEVRAAVSDNKSTWLSTLVLLSKDVDCDVRYQLAENHSLPLALLRSLTNDENPYVASRAQETYDRLQVR